MPSHLRLLFFKDIYLFLAPLCGMWDFSSLTPAVEAQSLNHWISREVSRSVLLGDKGWSWPQRGTGGFGEDDGIILHLD